jgi:hypothetical protein
MAPDIWWAASIEENRMNVRPQDEVRIEKSTEEARAGVTGRNVRYVLGWSLGGVILAFLVISVYFGWAGH